jgi:carboxymethylenebutenolidase
MPDLSIEVEGHGTIPAYYAPAQGVVGPAPGVVVIHEAFGLTDAMREASDQLAARGYHAVAPDLMSYAGNVRCLVSITRSLLPARTHLRQIHAARQWLAEREDSTGKVGVAGFCLGGAFTCCSPRGLRRERRDVRPAAGPRAHLRRRVPRLVASYGGKDRNLRGATNSRRP